jgi:hypothetical protein
LPENYRLFEHLKYSKAEAGESQRPARTHAKGGNERQDAYLYGHPLGRKKRYRCPADFFNHLLWLVTDEDGDPDHCTCKICCPEEIPKLEPTPAPTEAVEVRKEESRGPAQVLNPRNPNIQQPPKSPGPIASRVNPPLSPMPSSLAPFRSREQELDAQHSQYIYRPGEIAWFNRGAAWGLGVITKRELLRAGEGGNRIRPRYFLQPLSHPFDHPPAGMISDEAMLRPWLAWSAPNPTHDQLKGLTFESVNWQDVLDGKYGQHDAEVDGSILAAKSVDESYTPFDQINIPGAAPGTTYWNGLFLGAEKIWVGEAVRLRSTNSTDVLVIHYMMAASQTNNPTPILVLIGDQYSYATISYDPASPPPSNTHLPRRMQEDLAYRNSITQPRTGQVSYWALTKARAQVTLPEVRGRWYESGLLLPTLQSPQVFENDVRAGIIGDVGLFMNGRCDHPLKGDRVGTRKSDRLSAFGDSIPMDSQISQGLDELPADNGYVAQDTRSPESMTNALDINQGLESAPSENLVGQGNEMEQFMNLDGVDSGNQGLQFAHDGGQYYNMIQ